MKKFFGYGDGYLGVKKENNDLFILFSIVFGVGFIVGFFLNYIISIISLGIYLIIGTYLGESKETSKDK